jgi:hypothetical protein
MKQEPGNAVVIEQAVLN